MVRRQDVSLKCKTLQSDCSSTWVCKPIYYLWTVNKLQAPRWNWRCSGTLPCREYRAGGCAGPYTWSRCFQTTRLFYTHTHTHKVHYMKRFSTDESERRHEEAVKLAHGHGCRQQADSTQKDGSLHRRDFLLPRCFRCFDCFLDIPKTKKAGEGIISAHIFSFFPYNMLNMYKEEGSELHKHYHTWFCNFIAYRNKQ